MKIAIGDVASLTKLISDQDIHWFAEEAGAGLAFVPESATSLAEAVSGLCAMSPEQRWDLGNRGRKFYAGRLSFSRGVEGVLASYEAVSKCPVA
jgi:hypothetical protein